MGQELLTIVTLIFKNEITDKTGFAIFTVIYFCSGFEINSFYNKIIEND